MSGNVSISLSPANRNGNTSARRMRAAFVQAFCGAPHPPDTQELLHTFDDLMAHDDWDAASLALGDLWRQLPPVSRAMAANLVEELARSSVRASTGQISLWAKNGK